MTRLVIVLRRPLSPRECEVLAELVEAPAYKVVAARLRTRSGGFVMLRTVRQHVANIAALLPSDWFPNAEAKERVVFYAQRCAADAEANAARGSAA